MPSNQKEDDDELVPLSFWLLTGGTGPPPTISIFRRMASERKAAHREEISFRNSRKEAIARLQEELDSRVPKWLIKMVLKLEQRKRPDRNRLMEMFGGRKNAVGILRCGGDCVGGVPSPPTISPITETAPPGPLPNDEADSGAVTQFNCPLDENNDATNTGALTGEDFDAGAAVSSAPGHLSPEAAGGTIQESDMIDRSNKCE